LLQFLERTSQRCVPTRDLRVSCARQRRETDHHRNVIEDLFE
jgi:hypothetical protein